MSKCNVCIVTQYLYKLCLNCSVQYKYIKHIMLDTYTMQYKTNGTKVMILNCYNNL